MDGNPRLQAGMTVRAGQILYEPSGPSMVQWEKARPHSFVKLLGSTQLTNEIKVYADPKPTSMARQSTTNPLAALCRLR
jgi:hypothetical protein